jgi:PAS domain S-box-containing protein
LGWLRRRFIWTTVAMVVLVVAASAYLLNQVNVFARRQVESQLLETTRALSLVVDGEVRRYEAVLKALATSDSLARRDFAAFDAEARAQFGGDDVWILVSDRSGRQLVNTHLPADARLPSGPPLNRIAPELDRGATHVCNLAEGELEPRILCVDVPVVEDGRPALFLSVIFKPAVLQSIIEAQRVPGNRYATVLDRNGTVVWRNVDPETFVGRRATVDMLRALASRPEGVKESVSLDGVPTVIAYSRSQSGFSFLVGMPASQLGFMADWSLKSGLALAGAILLLAGLVAFLAGRRLSAAIGALAETAAALGRGEPFRHPRSGIPEVDAAADALGGAVAARAESDARFAMAQDVGGVGAWDWDVLRDEGFVTFGYRRLHGLDEAPGPLRLRQIVDVIHPEDRAGYRERLAAAMASREPATNEYRVVHPDGSIRWVAVKGSCVRDAQGRPVRALGVVADVTERKALETALRQQAADLEQTVEHRTAERNRLWQLSRDAFVVADGSGTWLSASPAWERILGWPLDQLVGRSSAWMEHPDDAAPTRAQLTHLADGGVTASFVNRFRTRDGDYRWFAWTAVADGELIYGVARDVTEEREQALRLERTQEALVQSQKVEAMGKVTGGVAHDVNNLLTPILGGLDLLQKRGLPDDRSRQLVTGALEAAERARVLVQRLLAFARRQPLQVGPVDVKAVVAGMRDLIASTLGPQIRISLTAADDLPPARADQSQLEMALLNLAVNARDAMPDGGTLAITIGRAAAPPSLPAGGDGIKLSVTDTGVGMSPDVVERAIEPFFSTKGIGRGTGLGLSMVHGLMAQLGGALAIHSTPGVGTTIDLWIPEAAAPADQPGGDRREAAPAVASGTVLLVDDEQLVRDTVAGMLAELGYAVVEAGSAAAALARLDDGLAIDALVTDHLMPGMTGTELARSVRARRPETRVVVISGYADVEDIAPDLPRLSKPFRQEELAAMLARDRVGEAAD